MTNPGPAVSHPPAGQEVDTSEGAAVAAMIVDVPVPQPTLPKAFAAMMARDFRVLRRNSVDTLTRTILQPLLFVFVFAYVLPKIGGGFTLGGRGGTANGAAAGAVTFATILVPGLMAMMLMMQGFMSVTLPLVFEFSWQRSIEDRALAPVPLPLLAIQKVVAGASYALLAGLIVFPIVLLVHAAGQAPDVHVTSWPLLILILVVAALFISSLGLLCGTVIDPRRMQSLLAIVLLPATMLGCAYYPWSALHSIRWLQFAVLVNPMVYMSEGLRAVLTPQVGHMPLAVVLPVLIGGTVVSTYLSTITFTRRVHS